MRCAARALSVVVAALSGGVGCTGLTPPPPPRPPACADGEQTRDAVGRLREQVPAKYPRAAARLGRSGFVCVNFTVRPDGTVGDICVTSQAPEGLFDRAAVEAVSQYVFEPGDAEFQSGTCLQFAQQR